MKKSILMICLMVAFSTILVGCDGEIYPQVPETQNTTQTDNSGDETSMKENNESGSTEKVPVEFTAKELNATPEAELISSGEAIENAKKDANRYAEIEKNPIVTMKIKDMGTITIELYPKIAPESVENFISLINKGVYDGLIFHRTIPGFMAQGGDPLGNGTGGPDYGVVGEFSANGIENNISHVRGVLSMARSSDLNSAGSQFFIVTTDSQYLDGNYAAFGKVLDGMEIADKIVNSEVLMREKDLPQDPIETMEQYIAYMEAMMKVDRPVNPPMIEKVTVETFGVEYAEPEKIRQEIQ